MISQTIRVIPKLFLQTKRMMYKTEQYIVSGNHENTLHGHNICDIYRRIVQSLGIVV